MPDERDDFLPSDIPHDGFDLRLYLRAVEAIDWTKVQTQHEEEHYADWFLVDHKVLMYAGEPEDQTIEFLRRAPAAIRQLIADVESWRERAETARSLAKQLAAEAEQGLKSAVLDSQRAAWSTQAHVAGLFLAALDDSQSPTRETIAADPTSRHTPDSH